MTNRFADGSEVWSAAGGGPGRQGLWDGRVLIESTPVWCLAVKGAVQASVVFDAAGRSLVADMAGWVHAFSVEGRLLWGRQIEGAVSATPAVDTTRDRVFAGTHLGWVYAMRASDGAVLWRQRLPTRSDARIGSDLLLTPGAAEVVSSSWGGRFCALDAGTGQTRRTWDAGLSPQAGASADRRGNLYSMRAVRGEGVVCVRLDRVEVPPPIGAGP
ncbi:MAG TPA: PQQ-binding-like beta-propeller repeat protein, partial [Verrucomicrobiota bacterium]|nr:PQQ-binding-like beta-propeller repeat protein [Verrucomicrobiota bacterium]